VGWWSVEGTDQANLKHIDLREPFVHEAQTRSNKVLQLEPVDRADDLNVADP
jgi:hypothetical protein